MRFRIIGILFLSAILLSSCSGKDHSVTVKQHKGRELMVMNIKDTKDSIRIKLTDIADSLKFIRLETKPECLISSATYYITDKYILAKSKTGIYQFDSKGKFIRLLVSVGQGPREYSRADWVVDEHKELLILADEQKTGYFLSFDLKTGDYHGDIPKAFPNVTRKMVLCADGTLACVPFMSPGDQPQMYYLYWQDLKGNLTGSIAGQKDLAVMRGNYFEPLANGFRYMLAFTNRDTIYTITDKSFYPQVAFNHGEEFPKDMEAVGYRTMKISMETGRYIFLNKDQVTRADGSSANVAVHWVSSEYVLDKTSKKAFLISGVHNDFMGTLNPAQFFRILPNHLIYIQLQAMEVIGIAERSIENRRSEQKLIYRMKEIRDQTSRDDNPVLLVGKIK